MAINYIDTSAKEVKTKKSKSSLKLFFKTALLTIAVACGILLVISAILAILIYPNAKDLAAQGEVTYAQANRLQKAIEDKNLVQADVELKKLNTQEKKTKTEYKKLSYLKYIPVLAGYYNDGTHLLNIADIGIDMGQKSLNAIEPFADVLGLGTGKKEEITAEKKAQTVVQEVIPKLVPLVDELDSKSGQINKELDQINPDHYPAGFKVKGHSVREGLTTAKSYLKKVDALVPEVKPLLLAAPEIAGSPTEKTYLILLQNDKELRATGGFITAYALLKVKGGQVVDTQSDDIYQLDLKYHRTELSPEAIQKYLSNTTLPIRDSNFSPDYKVAAQKFESMYNTIKLMPRVDGIFALDTEFVRMFLETTGPIKTKKTKEVWSADKNRLGIPDVVYKLELYSEKIHSGSPERKGVVGELMDALMDKVLNAKTDEIPSYLDTFVNAANQKHFLFYFHNRAAQDFVEKHNFAGQIHDYDGDYFHLNNSNFGGLKGNIYLKQKVVQNIDIDPDGTVTKKVDVTLSNTAKADGWLNSVYFNWMRIYVPRDSLLVTKQVQKDFSSGEEFDKEVYRGFSATYPLKSTLTSFTYRLPERVKVGAPYKMLIQKQPGVGSVDMTIKINGVEKARFDLKEDKEVTISY